MKIAFFNFYKALNSICYELKNLLNLILCIDNIQQAIDMIFWEIIFVEV
jgi:hypothetical protein